MFQLSLRKWAEMVSRNVPNSCMVWSLSLVRLEVALGLNARPQQRSPEMKEMVDN